MKDNFYLDSTKALSKQITEAFDFLWSTSAALWNLRWQVNGLINIAPDMTHKELEGRFITGSGIRGANLHESCIKQSWEAQQSQLAKFMISEMFGIYEAWTKLACNELAIPANALKPSELEFLKVSHKISNLPQSTPMEKSVYTGLANHRKHSAAELENLMLCYRFFKETRNSLIHHGGEPNQQILKIAGDFKKLSTSDLRAKEIPEHATPVAGKKLDLTLRGVAGFTDIILKIMITLDAELSKTQYGEDLLIKKWRTKLPRAITLPKDPGEADKTIRRHIRKLGIPMPNSGLPISKRLTQEGVIRAFN